jgi:DNA-binding NtrC family response regulator
VRRVQPDVVVTDVEMPLMDGYELLAKLRCLDRGLPVIVMSADGARDASRFSDAFCFIPKPATIDAVMVAVNEALLRRRRTRLRDFWITARAAANAVARRVRPDTRRRTRGRSRFALIAGFGVATAAAVVIAAIRAAAA